MPLRLERFQSRLGIRRLGEDPRDAPCQSVGNITKCRPGAGDQRITQREEVHVCPCRLVVVEAILLVQFLAWGVDGDVIFALGRKLRVEAAEFVVISCIQGGYNYSRGAAFGAEQGVLGSSGLVGKHLLCQNAF